LPEKKTIDRAREDAREGKSPSTQAGEFVREGIDHVREGKHGARSPEQAIAIGLSKARRAGIAVPAKKGAPASKSVTKRSTAAPSRKRSRAAKAALKREGTSSASKSALSKHAHKSALQRGSASRSQAAKKAARTRARRAK
jgi:hypothetical protein